MDSTRVFKPFLLDKDEFVHGIYLVYYHNLVIASEENRVDPQFVERLVQEYEIQAIQGRKEVLEGLVLDAFSREGMSVLRIGNIEGGISIRIRRSAKHRRMPAG